MSGATDTLVAELRRLVARIAAELADIPRGPIDSDREPLLAELVEEGTRS
jgi:hypothetical protein